MNCLNFLDKMMPNHTGQQQPSIYKKILFMFFPKFDMGTFTFWFGLIWAGLNTFIVL